MVNVGKVVRESVEYYVSQVAHSAEEYYSVKGEAQGQWMGRGAAELGLTNTVKSEQFTSVLHGRKPGVDTPLSAYFGRRKVLGVDAVFRAPKSVSLMYAIGDGKIRNEVIDAHEAAVRAGFEYLERMAAGGREGKGGSIKVGGTGLISSAWLHRTSREGDPLIHTHVVSANMIHAESGKWVALDAKLIYRHAKAAGVLYQAELRRELTRRLGVEWQPVENGLADVAGVSDTVIRAFSKRSQQIEDELDSIGGGNARSAQIATLKTRKAKNASDGENVFDSWAKEAAEYGFDASTVSSLRRGANVAREVKLGEYRDIAAELISPKGLTKNRSAFSRRDVILAFAERLPATTSANEIERCADGFISQNLIKLDNEAGLRGSYNIQGSREIALTTPDMAATERALVDSVVATRAIGLAVLPGGGDSHDTCERMKSLNDEQRAMVELVTSSGNGVDVVIGDAGTGKTYALGVLRERYEARGYAVLGVASTHRARHELKEGSGIETETVASLVGRIDRGLDFRDFIGVGRGTVIVVDEASMVGTRDLERIHSAATKSGVKVVLIGDPKQIASIDAGGAFDAIAKRLGCYRLKTNMRQRDEMERTIVDAYADGRIGDAVALGIEHGRIRVFDSGADALDRLVDDWALDPLRGNSLITAATNREAKELNRRCQRIRLEQGELSGEPIATSRGIFFEGDRIRIRRNGLVSGYFNLDTATVLGSTEPGGLIVRFDRTGEERNIGLHQLAEPRSVELAYASTVHIAQGATVDASYTLFSDSLSREHAYVAVTRGRERNLVYASNEVVREHAGFGAEIAESAQARITRAFERSEAQELAIDHVDTGGVIEVSRLENDDSRPGLEVRNGGEQSSSRELTSADAQLMEFDYRRGVIAGPDDGAAETVARIEALRDELVATPPACIVEKLGPPPIGSDRLTDWSAAAASIQVYRVKWGVASDEPFIGPKPTVRGSQVAEWRCAAKQADDFVKARRELTRAPAEVGRQLTLQRSLRR